MQSTPLPLVPRIRNVAAKDLFNYCNFEGETISLVQKLSRKFQVCGIDTFR